MSRILVGVDGSESALRAGLVLLSVSSLPFILDDELKAYAHAEHLYKDDPPRLLVAPRPPAL